MVRNNVVEYFLNADAQIDHEDKELEDLSRQIFEKQGFAEPDIIAVLGGPSEKEESQRYQAMNRIENELEAEVQRIDFLNHVETNSNYEKIDSSSTSEEVIELYERAENGDKIIVVTSDYHIPRTEKLMSKGPENNDYAIAGVPIVDTVYKENQHGYTDQLADILPGFESPDEEPVDEYKEKWCSEFVREFLPQKAKDFGKEKILPYLK